MTSTNLTVRFIEAAKPPKEGRNEYWDKNVRGLGFRVTDKGHKSWCLMYRIDGRQRRLTLGSYPIISLSGARERAMRALGRVADGPRPSQ